jgi:hypothetical protein
MLQGEALDQYNLALASRQSMAQQSAVLPGSTGSVDTGSTPGFVAKKSIPATYAIPGQPYYAGVEQVMIERTQPGYLQTTTPDWIKTIYAYEGDQMGETDMFMGMADANARAMEMMEEQTEKSFAAIIQLTERTAWAMQENFSDLFFDAMTGELDSLRDYASATLEAIQRAVADYMGQLVTAGLFGTDGGSSWITTGLNAIISGLSSSVSYAPAHVGAGGTTAFSMDSGGWLGEDVIGIGQRSGQSYEFHGDEVILPTSRLGNAGGVQTVNHYHIHNDIKANDAKSFNEMLTRSGGHMMGIVGAGFESNSTLRQQAKKAVR